jgi:putative peptide-modifying radical SAM enzyme
MKSIMDVVPAQFVIQTNGLFLDRIEPQLLERFHSILVSIDGTRETTDRERGSGVYDRVTRNLEIVRKRGFSGDLVARMTVVQGSNIYENVRHLLDTGLFDHVHWQLSFSMFWEAGDSTEPGLPEWITEYNSGVSSLLDWWLTEMKCSKRVPGIVPFIGVMSSLLTGRESHLRCGSGVDFFTVMPDGRVSACPVAVDFDFSVVGSIFGGTPASLCGIATIGEPCLSCDIFRICGGRCLFVNRSQAMLRNGGYSHICRTVRHLVAELQRALPEVRALIGDGSLRKSNFEYPEFNNGCEIIP